MTPLPPLLSLFIYIITLYHPIHTSFPPSKTSYLSFLNTHLHPLLNSTFHFLSSNISYSCLDMLNSTFLHEASLSNFSTLSLSYKYSSHYFNEWGSYSMCSQLDNFSFFIIETFPDISTLNFTFQQDEQLILNLCIPHGCDEQDLSSILKHINAQTDNMFHLNNSHALLNIFDVSKANEQIGVEFDSSDFNWVFILFSACYVLVFVLVNVFNGSSQRKWCCRKTAASQAKRNFCLLCIDEMRNSMNIMKNIELLVKEKNNENDIGFAYMKQLRSVMILLTMVGFVFKGLMYSSGIVYQEYLYKKLVYSVLYPCLTFSIRYAPRVLFSCSGFIMVNVLFSYLDAKLSKVEDEALQITQVIPFDNNINNNSNSQIDNNNNNNQSLSDLLFPKESDADVKVNNNNQSKCEWKWMFQFCLYQTHKYVISFITILFEKITLVYVLSLLTGHGYLSAPFVYLKKGTFDLIPLSDIIGHHLLYGTFNLTELNSSHYTVNSYHHNGINCILTFYSMLYNEIFFFIILVPIVFICYKHQFKINPIILSLTFLSFTTRLLIQYIYLHNNNPSLHIITNNEDNYYGLFALNPLFNLPFYLIGIIFGLVNYACQKGINVKEANVGNKQFIITSVYLEVKLLYMKQKTKYVVITVIISIIGLLSALMQVYVLCAYFSFEKFMKGELTQFVNSTVVKVVYSFDMEVVVIGMHVMCMVLYLGGNAVFHKLFKSKLWVVVNKLYFAFVLNGKMIVYYMIYHNESTISLQKISVMMFWVIGSVLIGVVGCVFFVVVEMPMKKITKIMVKKIFNECNTK